MADPGRTIGHTLGREQSRGPRGSATSLESAKTYDILQIQFAEGKKYPILLAIGSIADSRATVSFIRGKLQYELGFKLNATWRVLATQQELEDDQKPLKEYGITSGDTILVGVSSAESFSGPTSETTNMMSKKINDFLSTGNMRRLYQQGMEGLGREFALEFEIIFSQFFDDLSIPVDDGFHDPSRGEWVYSFKSEVNWLGIPNQCMDSHNTPSTALQRASSKLSISSWAEITVSQRGSSNSSTMARDEDFGTDSDAWEHYFDDLPLQTLEARTKWVLDPPSTSEDALDYENSSLLAIMMDHDISGIAVGQNSWVQDLADIGYSNHAIAQLVYERRHDSPWIFRDPFSPARMGPGQENPKLAHHIPSCAHESPKILTRSETLAIQLRSHGDKGYETLRTVHEMCGLGGISLCSRNKDSWAETAEFFDDNTVVHLGYSLGRSNQPQLLDGIINVARNLCLALKSVQIAQLCCDSFTVLRFTEDRLGTEIEVRPIPFSLVVDLTDRLKSLSNDIQNVNLLKELMEASWHILTSISCDMSPQNQRPALFTGLHLASLAVQTLCVAFLSYCQAHIGQLHYFFLDTSLKEVVLLGTNAVQSYGEFHVIARLADLTCLESMCQGPVMVFQLCGTTPVVTRQMQDSMKFDVRSSPENILDTWGPGLVVFRTDDTPVPIAIKIGGGFINPPVSGGSSPKYHWDVSLQISNSSQTLDMKNNILVGSLVTINSKCPNEEKKCWEMASSQFEELGTYQSYVETAEYQFGFQGGPDSFAMTANKVWAKRRGRTIKNISLERGDDGLVRFLHYNWGVRVSYCTSVAQRVSLIQLVGDLLPAFAKGLTGEQKRATWKELEMTHDVHGRFRDAISDPQALSEWLSILPEDLFQFALSLIRQILMTLQDTGLSPDGQYFVVAWPYDGTLHLCFRFTLTESDNKWMTMLADSDDCATFAYMTNACIESHQRVCRSPDPTWENRIHMLETAVLNPRIKGTSCLSAEQTYFFRKLDGALFWVKALRDSQAGMNGPMILTRLVSLQSLPRDVIQRLMVKEEQRMQKRLRERDLMTVAAETVYVVSEAKMKGRS